VVTKNNSAVQRVNTSNTKTAEAIVRQQNREFDNADWEEFYPEVEGRHNILHDYNTYSYNIAITSLTDAQYNDPKSTYKQGVIDTNGQVDPEYYVISRSGSFEKMLETTPDIYVENLTFETRTGINNVGQPNVTKGSMEIIEPYSASGFYEELFSAAQFAGYPNYLGAPFLLIIQFFGRKVDKDQAEVVPDATRYLPIKFTKSNMKVTEAGARYDVEFISANADGAASHAATLRDDSEVIGQTKSTVQSYAYKMFLDQNEQEEQQMKKRHQDYASKEAEIKKIIDETKTSEGRVKAGIGSSVTVDSFVPEKFCVWFPDETGFPESMKDLKFDTWKGIAESFVAVDNSGATAPGGYENYISKHEMQDTVTVGQNVSHPNVDEQLKKEKESLDKGVEALNKQMGIMETQKGIAEGKIASLEALLKKYAPPNEEDTSQAPETKLTNIPDRAVAETTKITEKAETIATKVKTSVAAGVKAPPGIGIDPNQGATVIAQVDTLTKELNTALQEYNKAAGEIPGIKEKIETANKNATTLRTKPLPRIGDKGKGFYFKKGSNLFTNIEYLILNSEFTETLVKADKGLTDIVNSHFVKWFKISVQTKIIAFDVVKGDYAYEYHYFVEPYQIHYSQLPGIQIIFKTDELRQRAVREYNYIYTGKNLDVLSFDIQYNNLFKVPLVFNVPDVDPNSQDTKAKENENIKLNKDIYQSNIETIVKNRLGVTGVLFTPGMKPVTKSSLPTNNKSEIAAAFNEFLYNPPAEQALIRSEIEIIGDPVYIIGSGIGERPALTNEDIVTEQGEMNTFTREPDIIFNFRFGTDLPSARDTDPYMKMRNDRHSGLYRVAAIENRFSEGMFTQRIMGLRRKNQEIDYEDDGQKQSGNFAV